MRGRVLDTTRSFAVGEARGVVGPARAQDWDRIVGACDDATFYHTRAWARVCERTFPSTRAYGRHFCFDDGVEALVPGTVQSVAGGFGREFTSTRTFDYGGPVSKDPLSSVHREAIVADLLGTRVLRVAVYENPFGPPTPFEGFTPIGHTAHVIDLSDGVESWITACCKQTRRTLRSAEAGPVRVVRTSSCEATRRLYDLYLRAAQVWGDSLTWLRPFELCRSAAEICGDYATIRFALCGDTVIGASMDYFHRNICSAGWRVFDRRYGHLHPSLLLVQDGVKEAVERGCRFYDMGASGDLAGVAEFKRRCGARAVEYHAWLWKHPTLIAADGLHAVARSVRSRAALRRHRSTVAEKRTDQPTEQSSSSGDRSVLEIPTREIGAT